MKEINLSISGMTCNHCVMAIKKELAGLELESAEVAIGSAKITYNEEKTSLQQIIDSIEEAGYKVVQ